MREHHRVETFSEREQAIVRRLQFSPSSASQPGWVKSPVPMTETPLSCATSRAPQASCPCSWRGNISSDVQVSDERHGLIIAWSERRETGFAIRNNPAGFWFP